MKALEAFGGVCGESVCETLVREFEAGLVELTSDEVFVALPDLSDLSPEGVLDLPFGGCSGDDECLFVCHEPPDHGERGGVCLARCVAGSDGDLAVEFECAQYLSLLLPGFFVQPIDGKCYGVLEWFCGCLLSEPLITLIFVMGCDLGCLLLGSVMDGVVLGRVWVLHLGITSQLLLRRPLG